MLADHLRRTLDKDRRVGKAVAQHVRPDRGQLATARHVGSPAVGAFDLSRRNVSKLQVDDLAVVLLALSFGPFLLNARARRPTSVRHTTPITAGAAHDNARCWSREGRYRQN